MIVIYSQLTNPTALLFGGFFMGMFANGMIGGYGTLIAELFPTEVRGTAQTALYNAGRFIGGASAPGCHPGHRRRPRLRLRHRLRGLHLRGRVSSPVFLPAREEGLRAWQ